MNINAFVILILTVLWVVAVLDSIRLRKKYKHAKQFATVTWRQLDERAKALQNKQAELARAQKRVKRLERLLEKNNLAHLS